MFLMQVNITHGSQEKVLSSADDAQEINEVNITDYKPEVG